jgi:hypothetical protein
MSKERSPLRRVNKFTQEWRRTNPVVHKEMVPKSMVKSVRSIVSKAKTLLENHGQIDIETSTRRIPAQNPEEGPVFMITDKIVNPHPSTDLSQGLEIAPLTKDESDRFTMLGEDVLKLPRDPNHVNPKSIKHLHIYSTRSIRKFARMFKGAEAV